ncbi:MULTISPECIES: DUF5388 domain-containing protein [Lactobacillales]|uniref:DUF5388 domain-containing protein n=1 Tax=Lactobacillales TaxID=186826 RepID=UPI000704C22C|nr:MULTISPECIES: DUF5388 domain-containing protein [Lactobacillales]MCO8288683.1 hypothetical protein [Tetragenococcus halophilus]MDT1946650.1 DUF5388 domain-containing protein [Carnobacterium maltaromaticum]MDT2001012.1 DUF5388 domain-containing protein [Carnobacterium maltaromaticum]TFI60626.1 hypothetical protein CKN59_13045 [Carnobacterium divergens]TFI61468.1 hypothetical protein CKN76_13060 [Carnobacterium divergens]
MGMLNQSNKKKLEWKPNPVINQQIDRNELNIGRILSNSESEPSKLGIRSTTERATIKVDNHVRNMLTSLVNIGMFDSQKDAVEKMCFSTLDSLSDDERKRFDFILDSLELKDYNKQQRAKKI